LMHHVTVYADIIPAARAKPRSLGRTWREK